MLKKKGSTRGLVWFSSWWGSQGGLDGECLEEGGCVNIINEYENSFEGELNGDVHYEDDAGK